VTAPSEKPTPEIKCQSFNVRIDSNFLFFPRVGVEYYSILESKLQRTGKKSQQWAGLFVQEAVAITSQH
jgi:hypothetical protein